MKRRILSTLIAFILLYTCSNLQSSTAVTAAPLACAGAYCYHLPLVRKPVPPTYLSLVMVPEEPTMIINHNNIDISKIPDMWLTAARALTFHYAHTSHGGQIFEGMQYLETYKSSTKYAFAVQSGVTPPSLPAGTDSLRFYDGNNYGGDSYIYPWMYWSDEGHGLDGVNHTYSTANTGLFDYSMWSWCGQADTSSVSYIDQYLVQMSAFEAAFPNMRFILMTGHNVGNPGTNLLARNQQIRDYATTNKVILFDFADIETYDPDGTFYNPATWNYSDGNCPWCTTWCNADADNQAYCTNLPSCAHTHGLFCKMKAQAFWWMMARLAGWPGS